MKVFVTGGAGYIGSITAQALLDAGHEVVIFDRVADKVKERLAGAECIKGDLLNQDGICAALSETRPDAVIHFAAYIQMGESMENPQKYYENNFLGSYNLLNGLVDHGIKKIVFSSSAGVYGNPPTIPIPEDVFKNPTNPYGEIKLAVERLLLWYDKAYGLRSISIRYFNAAGASFDRKFGELHDPETHLIPNVIRAERENGEMILFGDDYPTKDGTCIRDYVHVLDLASAHMKALEALAGGAGSAIYNAGSGVGYSNREIINMVEKISGKKIRVKIMPRREGDANELVADTTRIKKELGWKPQYSDLETIIRTAYEFHASQ